MVDEVRRSVAGLLMAGALLMVNEPDVRAAEEAVQPGAVSASRPAQKGGAPLLAGNETVPDAQSQDLANYGLADALADAYASNPELAARRFELRATDNELGLALSETRANAQLQISGGIEHIDPGRRTNATRPLVDRLNDPTIDRNDLGAQLVIDQPISTGGKAKADVRAAGAQIRAGREVLRGAEGDLLVNVIAAYADVRQDSAALAIREKNLHILGATLDEVIARREAGELTRTDIAQAQNQLQAASVQLNAAHAQLQQSRASFAALVGREAGVLAPMPSLPLLPATIDEAFEVAERFNPEIAAAVHAERASRARIAAARAEGHPTLAVRGIAGATGPASPFHEYNEDYSLSARATLTVPLTSGGRVSALVGQAADRNSADRLKIESAKRQMVRAIISAWNQMETARRNLEVQQSQLSSARIYYEGSFEEYRAGLRSTFDVLYAQNALRETEVALLASRRDHYVAQAALLRQLGMLEVGKLLTGTPVYDPTAHVRQVAGRSAMPWDGAIRAIDRVGSPGERARQVELLSPSSEAPDLAPASKGTPERDLITRSPILAPSFPNSSQKAPTP
jgi:outer membrane protein